MPQPAYLTLPVKDWKPSNYSHGSPLWDELWKDLEEQKRGNKKVLSPYLHPRYPDRRKFYAWHFPAEHFHPNKTDIKEHQLFLEILEDDKIHLRMVRRRLNTSNDQPLDKQLIEEISDHLKNMLEGTDINFTLM